MSIVAVSSRISDNTLAASDDSFSSALALMKELSLLNLMWSKGTELVEKVDNKISRGTWSTNSDHFHEKLNAKSRQFAALSPGERLLRVIGELQMLMEVEPRDLHTRLDLSEMADDLCNAAVRILREDKKAEFTGNDVAAMLRFQMTRVFAGLNIPMDELSEKQREKLVSEVRGVVQSLPVDQQRFIMEKLGASDLSESAIRQALASGAIWTVFAAAVQVFGFAFYTTAAQLLAILSLHLLPFGAYVGLSSFIAVLASPWMLPISAGIGIWYYRSKNRGLRKSMAPLIVTSLCLSGMEGTGGHKEVAVEEALSLWEAARTIRDQKRAVTATCKSNRDEAQSCLNNTRNELSDARSQKSNFTRDRGELEEKLADVVKSSVYSIAQGSWGSSLTSAASKARQVENEFVRARQRRDSPSDLLGKLKANAKYLVEIAALRGQLNSSKKALVQQVKSNWPVGGSTYPPDPAALLREMEEIASKLRSTEGDISRLQAQERDRSKSLDRAFSELRSAEAAQAASEKRYYGLGTV